MLFLQRWGDAPVHSIAASLFARKDQVHFFNDIGYRHPPFQHCPQGEAWSKRRCSCNPSDSFGTYNLPCFTGKGALTQLVEADYQDNSCLRRYEKLF
jgi:alpha 1,2-mannosyltransferase